MWASLNLDEKTETTCQGLRTHLARFKAEGRRVFATSSFQTQSVPLLHVLSENFRDAVTVVLIDTGFLFPETYDFALTLQAQFGFTLEQVRAKRSHAEQLNPNGQFLHTSDIERCCRINKVDPMADLLSPGDVWLSGIRADQTANRAQKASLETDPQGILRYHPMLAWTNREIYAYIRAHALPKHPLEPAGYVSIGCMPCTRKWAKEPGSVRSGRWEGSKKTECGLHLS